MRTRRDDDSLDEEYDDSDDPRDSDQDDHDDPETAACPFCGREVSELAEICPSCGNFMGAEHAPGQRTHPTWVIVTAALILAAMLLGLISWW